MSRKLTFTVTVEFADKVVDDNEVIEVAENIARAIVDESQSGMGIAPEESETFLESVEVKPVFLDKTITKKAY